MIGGFVGSCVWVLIVLVSFFFYFDFICWFVTFVVCFGCLVAWVFIVGGCCCLQAI